MTIGCLVTQSIRTTTLLTFQILTKLPSPLQRRSSKTLSTLMWHQSRSWRSSMTDGCSLPNSYPLWWLVLPLGSWWDLDLQLHLHGILLSLTAPPSQKSRTRMQLRMLLPTKLPLWMPLKLQTFFQISKRQKNQASPATPCNELCLVFLYQSIQSFKIHCKNRVSQI